MSNVTTSTTETSSATADVQLIYQPSRNARQDIAAALGAASRDSKNVLIDLGADWCPDCVVLSQLYRSPSVAPFLNSHYHLVTVYVGHWDANVDVSDHYHHAIDNGIPALVVLDPQGHIVTTTADGSFADARTMTPDELLTFLQRWAGAR